MTKFDFIPKVLGTWVCCKNAFCETLCYLEFFIKEGLIEAKKKTFFKMLTFKRFITISLQNGHWFSYSKINTNFEKCTFSLRICKTYLNILGHYPKLVSCHTIFGFNLNFPISARRGGVGRFDVDLRRNSVIVREAFWPSQKNLLEFIRTVVAHKGWLKHTTKLPSKNNQTR